VNKNLLTIRQAAKELGISPDTLRRWDKAGKLKATRHPMNNYRIYSTQTIAKIKSKLCK
jgi:site-specific DNA-methyltransferase (adenine-specific)